MAGHSATQRLYATSIRLLSTKSKPIVRPVLKGPESIFKRKVLGICSKEIENLNVVWRKQWPFILSQVSLDREPKEVKIRCLNFALDKICERGEFQEAFEILKTASGTLGVTPNSASLDIVMNATRKPAPKLHLLEFIHPIFDTLVNNFKVVPKLKHYNAALMVCSMSKNINKPMKYFMEMQSKSIQPTLRSFEYILRAFARYEGSVELLPHITALEVFDSMENKYKISPSFACYDALIRCCCNYGKRDEAFHIMDKMEMNNVDIDDNTSISVSFIKMHTRNGDWVSATKEYEFMHALGLQSREAFNELMTCYIEWKQADLALKMFKETVNESHLVEDCSDKPIIKLAVAAKLIKLFEDNKDHANGLLFLQHLLEHNNKCIKKLHLRPFHFTPILYLAIEKHQVGQVMKLVDSMVASGVVPKVTFIRAFTRAMMEHQPELSPSLFRLRDDIGLGLDLKKYNITINQLSKLYASRSCYTAALTLYNDVVRKHTTEVDPTKSVWKPDSYTTTPIISMHMKCKEYKKALELFESIYKQYGEEPSVVEKNVAITAYSKTDKFEKAWSLYSMMVSGETLLNTPSSLNHPFGETIERNDVNPSSQQNASSSENVVKSIVDIWTFQAIVNACAEVGEWEKAIHVLNSLESEHKIKPNNFVFASVINACEKAGKSKVAIKMFERMVDKGLKPNVVCYTVVMNALIKEDRCREVLNLFEEMKQVVKKLETRGLKCDDWKPTIITINTVMLCYQKLGEPLNALNLFYSLQEYNLTPDVYTFSTIFKICADDIDLSEQMEPLFESMQRDYHIMPNRTCINSLMAAHVKTGKYDQGLQFLEQMETKFHIKPCLISFNTAIDACDKLGDWRRALQLLQSMEEQYGVKPNVISYNGVIGACQRGGESDKAAELLNLMESRGLKPDMITFSRAIAAFSK